MVDALWRDLNKSKLMKITSEPVDSTSSAFMKTQEVFLRVVQPDKATSESVLPKGEHPVLKLLQYRSSPPEFVKILCTLGAHTAAGNLAGVSRDWSYIPKENHRAGIEIILQTALFAGFQRTMNALETVHQIGVDPSALLDEEFSTPSQYLEKGEKLLKLIYNKQEPKLREKMRRMHPDVESLIIEFAYGRVLSRECPNLLPKWRELAAIACLAGAIVFPQLHSHLLGALNAGCTMEDIRGTLDLTDPVWGSARQAMVDGFWLDFQRQRTKI